MAENDAPVQHSEYIAHRKETEEQKWEEQPLHVHLKHTAELASKFASSFDAAEWGYFSGMVHDIGKYSQKFQRKIRGENIRVDHSTVGAQLAWNKNGLYQLMSYCIAGHHAGLPDSGSKQDDESDGTLYGRLEKKVENYEAYKQEIEISKIQRPPFSNTQGERFPDFTVAAFIRFIFSCLVDADYLDTEAFMKRERNIQYTTIEELTDRLDKYMKKKKWLENAEQETVNGHRTEILKSCISLSQGEKGIYQLTVPTGGGKTVSSLAFALHHAAQHKMERIIYVIPYTSIIEQTAEVFREILGAENVLEHHSNVDYEEKDIISEEIREKLQLATENWDCPVIVTTNVQFFESLYASRTSQCRKLHNIANSVIIYDEVQMLPVNYIKPCIVMMEQLYKYYGCTEILCTATQPAIPQFFSESVQVKELCPRVEEQFRFFKRCRLVNLGTLSEEELAEKLSDEKRALCIVNTRKKAQRLYQMMEKMGREDVFHLSTTMYPKHRQKKYAEIKNRLAEGKTCLVISTSLVEAGVDLDFDTVYREKSGLDSMIQAAGRCNRNGKRKIEESNTYIFSLENAKEVQSQKLALAVTETLMQKNMELDMPETIESYFEQLYHYKGKSLDEKDIVGRFKRGELPFRKVSEDFHLIGKEGISILITKEAEARTIFEEIRQKGMTKELLRKASRYSVNVYVQDAEKFFRNGMIEELSMQGKTNLFVISDEKKYTDEYGLMLEIEEGEGIFF